MKKFRLSWSNGKTEIVRGRTLVDALVISKLGRKCLLVKRGRKYGKFKPYNKNSSWEYLG